MMNEIEKAAEQNKGTIQISLSESVSAKLKWDLSHRRLLRVESVANPGSSSLNEDTEKQHERLLKDISQSSSFRFISCLRVVNHPLTSTSSLSGLVHLNYLTIRNGPLEDLSDLQRLPLISLDVSHNKLREVIFPTGFQRLRNLDVSGNPQLSKLFFGEAIIQGLWLEGTLVEKDFLGKQTLQTRKGKIQRCGLLHLNVKCPKGFACTSDPFYYYEDDEKPKLNPIIRPKRLYKLFAELSPDSGKSALYKSICRGYQVPVAVKRARIKKMDRNNYVDEFFEPIILPYLKHPHIVHVFDVFEHRGFFFTTMELVPRDLTEVLAMDEPFRSPNWVDKEQLVSSLFHQICSAIAYLQSLFILHRDVKADNILVYTSQMSSGQQSYTLKLADFSFGCFFDPKLKLVTACGSVEYIAPEALMCDACEGGSAVDIWSMGVTLYLMLCADFPFHGETLAEITISIARNATSIANKFNPSPDLERLLRGMLEMDQRKRITLKEILANPWVSWNGEITLEVTTLDSDSDHIHRRERAMAKMRNMKDVVKEKDFALLESKDDNWMKRLLALVMDTL